MPLLLNEDQSIYVHSSNTIFLFVIEKFATPWNKCTCILEMFIHCMLEGIMGSITCIYFAIRFNLTIVVVVVFNAERVILSREQR